MTPRGDTESLSKTCCPIEPGKILSRCSAASLLVSRVVWTVFYGAKAPQSSNRQQRFDDCCPAERRKQKSCPDAQLQVNLQAEQSGQYFKGRKAHSHQSANGGLMTVARRRKGSKSLSRCSAASLLASRVVWTVFYGAKAPQSSNRQQRFDDCCPKYCETASSSSFVSMSFNSSE